MNEKCITPEHAAGIATAIRTMNARQNAYEAAIAAVLAILPEGVTVYHDDIQEPSTIGIGEARVVWTYEKDGNGSLLRGVSVLIKIPAPKAEME